MINEPLFITAICGTVNFSEPTVLTMSGTKFSCIKTPLTISLALALAACNGSGEAAPHGLSPTRNVQDVTPKLDISATSMNLKEQIEFSKKALAQRLAIEPESITLSEAHEVTWRSGALGCPEPGMNYTQALVPGALIFLRAGNEVHGYHVKIGGKPFYCPRQRAEQPVSGQGADMTWTIASISPDQADD